MRTFANQGAKPPFVRLGYIDGYPVSGVGAFPQRRFGDLSLRATCPGCRLYGHVERLRRAIQDPPLELRAMWSDPGPMLLVV